MGFFLGDLTFIALVNRVVNHVHLREPVSVLQHPLCFVFPKCSKLSPIAMQFLKAEDPLLSTER